MVMLGDAVSAKKSSGEAKESLEVVDVAQLLVRSVQPAAPGSAALDSAAPGSAAADSPAQQPAAEEK